MTRKADELRANLEALVSGRRESAMKRHGHLLPVLADLYKTGCTVKQLEKMFRVPRKFVRDQLPKAQGITFRGVGARQTAAVPSVDRIIEILKKHGLTLNDLPGLQARSANGASPKATSAAKRAKQKP